jgi:aryl-phospho-beta-D-glucosidase BglC (GH1 family)
MPSELSHDLPWLETSGNRILRSDTAQPVLLRGVNRSGLEYSEPTDGGFLAGAEFTEDEVRAIVSDWGANIIRVPFNQDWALCGRKECSPEEYRASLDKVISWASARGAYTILDLQWLNAETVYGYTQHPIRGKTPNRVAPTPDANSSILWRMLAERYRDEPAVLFDLFNEPHEPLGDDFLPIRVIGPDGEVVESDTCLVGPKEWVPWATRLVAEIRTVRPKGLVLVGGVDWAFDLRGVRVEAPGIVYSAHIYPHHKPGTWWKALGAAGEVPVFIGEWGGTAGDLGFGRRLSQRLRRLGLGWTAWSWVDYPELVQTPRVPDYEPTAFGVLVRSQLRKSEHRGR